MCRKCPYHPSWPLPISSHLSTPCPTGTVVVADRVAADHSASHGITGRIVGLSLIGNLLPIIGGEEVVPLGIFVGILNCIPTQSAVQHISSRVVGIGFRSPAVRGLGQLPEFIILETLIKRKCI